MKSLARNLPAGFLALTLTFFTVPAYALRGQEIRDNPDALSGLEEILKNPAEAVQKGLSKLSGLEETVDQKIRKLGVSQEPITAELIEKIQGLILREGGEEPEFGNPYLEGEESKSLLSDLLRWMSAPTDAVARSYPSDFSLLIPNFKRGNLDSRDPVVCAAFVAWVMGNFPVFYRGNHRIG